MTTTYDSLSPQDRMTSVIKAIRNHGPLTMVDLVTETGLTEAKIREALAAIRDVAPDLLITQFLPNMGWVYVYATSAGEVLDYVDRRARGFYTACRRLARLVGLAHQKWPQHQMLRILNKNLTRLVEDVQDLIGAGK